MKNIDFVSNYIFCTKNYIKNCIKFLAPAGGLAKLFIHDDKGTPNICDEIYICIYLYCNVINFYITMCILINKIIK